MKHLITKMVVLNTFNTLLECLKAGKTITLRDLTERVNQLQRNANVNELVMASLLNTVYTHPNNEFTTDIQTGIKFTKPEISALTVLCFECGQDVYPKWLTIGNKSDCANLMRDRNNTLVMMRAKHMEKPSIKELLKAGDVAPLEQVEKVLEEQLLEPECKRQTFSEVVQDFLNGNVTDVGTEIVNQVKENGNQFCVGVKKALTKQNDPTKLVSSLELRTVAIGSQSTLKHTSDFVQGAKPDSKPTGVTEEQLENAIEETYMSTRDSVLLGDYRNLALALTKAAIWNIPVTFETLCSDVGVSKGKLSDMVINIVETLPDTMHAGLLRNLLTFIEKPNGDVPRWWMTASNETPECDVRAMRKYVANGLSGQWHQLINAHKRRDKETSESNLVKFKCVEGAVKSVLANILFAKGSSAFDVQSVMDASVKVWDNGTASNQSRGQLDQSIFQAVDIIVWFSSVENLPTANKHNSQIVETMKQNAYIPYGEAGCWFYREFPFPHSVCIVEK